MLFFSLCERVWTCSFFLSTLQMYYLQYLSGSKPGSLIKFIVGFLTILFYIDIDTSQAEFSPIWSVFLFQN